MYIPTSFPFYVGYTHLLQCMHDFKQNCFQLQKKRSGIWLKQSHSYISHYIDTICVEFLFLKSLFLLKIEARSFLCSKLYNGDSLDTRPGRSDPSPKFHPSIPRDLNIMPPSFHTSYRVLVTVIFGHLDSNAVQ